MTTLSLLRDKQEFQSLKVKAINGPDHKLANIELVREDYLNWSRCFSDSTEYYDEICLQQLLYMYGFCESKQRLLAIVKFLSFANYFDISEEHCRVKRSSELMETVVKKLITVLDTNYCDKDFAIGNRLKDSLNALFIEMSDSLKTIFMDELKKSLKAHLRVHCDYWLKDLHMPYDQYYAIRSIESMWFLFIHMCEYGIGYQVPDNVRNNPLIQKHFNSCLAFALSVDDLYLALPKLLTNDITNQVLAYTHHQKCSLQEAIDYQYRQTLDLEKDCIDLCLQIKANPELVSKGLIEWVFELSYFGYTLVKVIYDMQKICVKEDDTIECEYWAKLYARTQLGDNSITNPFRYDKV